MQITKRHSTYALLLAGLMVLGPDAFGQRPGGASSGGGGARSGGSIGGGGGGGSIGGGGGGGSRGGGSIGGGGGGGGQSRGGGAPSGGGSRGGSAPIGGGGGGGSPRSSGGIPSSGGSSRSIPMPSGRSSGGIDTPMRQAPPSSRPNSSPSAPSGSPRTSRPSSGDSGASRDFPSAQPSSGDSPIRYTRPNNSGPGSGAPSTGPSSRTTMRQPPGSANNGSDSTGSTIEAVPRRVPFPRLTTPSGSGANTGAPSSDAPASGPSSRTRNSAGATRTRGSNSDTPITPARTIDRDKILERYNRPSGAADRTDATPRDSNPSTRVRPTPSTREPGARRDTADNAAHAGKSVDEIAHARNQYRLDHSDEIRAKRDAYRAQQATREASHDADVVRHNRDQYRDAQNVSLDTRRAAIAAKQTEGLRNAGVTNPRHWDNVNHQGHAVACGSGWSFHLGLSLGFGCCSPWGWCGYYSNCYWPWWSSYTYGGCGPYYWNACGGYSWNWYCHPFSLCYAYNYGCWPYNIGYWFPYCYSNYYYSPPVYYSTVIDHYYTDDQYSGDQPQEQTEEAPAQSGESVEYSGGKVRAPAAQSEQKPNPELDRLFNQNGPDSAARASAQNLSLGDQAFRDRRYTDAVHFYAKAVEFRPNEGVLYLVLSDALFATGDYHYGAFALRRAFELDPTLASGDIDKRTFYSEPSEFETQMQTLERFLADRPTDGDARLLLAANYLFSGRASLASDLLESGASEAVRNEAAGKLLLEAAKKAINSKK
jgi:cytochrome c-type biogenesis protein CcmH/NrfG